jgi:polysaccharide biosynthesis transport protein
MNQKIDIRYLFEIVRRRFYLFLIPVLLLAGLGTLGVMSLPAIYTADAKILVESQQIPSDLVKSTVTTLANERIQIIQQRVLTRDNLLGLVDKFELFKDRQNVSKTDLVNLMRDRIAFQQIDLQSANKQRKDILTAAFAIEFNYEQPDVVVRVVNELVTTILDEDVRSRTGQASDTTKFLQREAQRLATELTAVQSQISEFKLQNTETLPEKLAFNMSLLERTERGIADAQREVLSNEEQQRLLKLEASFKGTSGGLDSADAITALKKKLAELQLEYAVRKKTLSEKHPEMKMLRNTMSAVEDQLKAEPAQQVEPASESFQGADGKLYEEKLNSLAETKKIAVAQLEKLNKDAEKLRAVVVKTPETGSTLSVLERKESALQKSLDDITDKYSQARLGQRMEQDQQAERFQVIEQPVVPQSPTKPKRLQLLAAVLFLSMGAGVAVSGGAEFLDGSIRRAADIERHLKERPLVVIPYIHTQAEDSAIKRKRKIAAAAWMVGILLALVAVHIFYRPLDEIFYRLLGR